MKKVKVFHGTSAENAKDILENGFTNDIRNWNPSEPNTVYVWNSDKIMEHEDWEQQPIQNAFESAQISAALQKSNSPYVVVFEFEIDEDELVDDTSCTNMDDASCINIEILNQLIKNKEVVLKEYIFQYAPMLTIFHVAGLLNNPNIDLYDFFSCQEMEAIERIAKTDYWFDELIEMYEYV